MEIKRLDEILQRQFGKETRSYHNYDDVRIIVTNIPAGHRQPLHRHRYVSELFYVVEGSVTAVEGDDEWEVVRGESFMFRPSLLYHTIENRTLEDALMLTLKLIPDPELDTSHFINDREEPDA